MSDPRARTPQRPEIRTGAADRRRRLETLGRLTAGIAHDLNNELAVVLGFGGLLESDAPELRPAVGQILAAAQRSKRLVRQLLDFGRASPGLPPVVDANEVVRELAPMLRRLVRANAEMRLDLDPRGAPAVIDRGRLEQVVVNLVTNAGEAMCQGGLLRIETRADEGLLRLAVVDTGVGIDATERERILEPFFSTKEGGGSRGLGLAIVREIMDESGGEHRIDSEPGQGTRVEVRLPRPAASTRGRPAPHAGAGALRGA